MSDSRATTERTDGGIEMPPEQLDAFRAWVDARIEEQIALSLRRGSGVEEGAVERAAWAALKREMGDE